MPENKESLLEQMNTNSKDRRSLWKIVTSLSLVVVFIVFWNLKLTGIGIAGEAFCGKQEHVHSDSCVEKMLICNQEETTDHTHTDACYEITECCQLEEHTHIESCYSDITADIETSDDWEMTLADMVRGPTTKENVVLIAKSQLGYTESTLNFQVDANGVRRGITRYGQWYGNPYGDWSAMFASFCLYVVPGVNTTPIDATDYTVKTGAEVTDGCDFEIHFSQAVCDKFETNDKIIILYNATLNEAASIGNENSNDNTAWLTFGDLDVNGKYYESNKDTVSTYTYAADIIKTDSGNKLIDGAEFKIYDAATGGNEVAVVEIDDKNYRRAADQTGGDSIIVKDGEIRVHGLDNGTYYLEEKVAPDGFNKLTSRQKFIISDNNLYATFNGEIYSSGSGVHVVNKNGTMLPETGGLGTLLFTVLGGGAALSTGVVLVTKKRMSKIEDED